MLMLVVKRVVDPVVVVIVNVSIRLVIVDRKFSLYRDRSDLNLCAAVLEVF